MTFSFKSLGKLELVCIRQIWQPSIAYNHVCECVSERERKRERECHFMSNKSVPIKTLFSVFYFRAKILLLKITISITNYLKLCPGAIILLWI